MASVQKNSFREEWEEFDKESKALGLVLVGYSGFSPNSADLSRESLATLSRINQT